MDFGKRILYIVFYLFCQHTMYCVLIGDAILPWIQGSVNRRIKIRLLSYFFIRFQ